MVDNERVATAEALAPMSNELAHSELVQALASDIASKATAIELALTDGRSTDALDQREESGYLVEFLTSDTLGKECWSAKTAASKTREGLVTMANQLRGMCRRFRGSEMEDTRIQQLTERMHDREHQLTIAEAWSEAANAVYLEMTGREYGPANGDAKPATTAAAVEADAMVTKYAATPPRRIDDSRPTTHTEGNDEYVLGQDGRYYLVA